MGTSNKTQSMVVLYRISNNSYNKKRTSYSTKEKCLKNALSVFQPSEEIQWYLYEDNLNDETKTMVDSIVKNHKFITQVSVNTGSGAASFNLVLDKALTFPTDTKIAFLEDDYAWSKNCLDMVYEGLEMGANYVTTYIHPDKFMTPEQGGNPEVDTDGGYVTKLYKGKKWLWFMVNSTTMTFFTTVKTLLDDQKIIKSYIKGTYPRDYEMFIALRNNGKVLLCPTESGSSHLEDAWLGLFKNWEHEMNEASGFVNL